MPPKFRAWVAIQRDASVRREAVEQAGAADALQVRRSTARRFVRKVPEVGALGVADEVVVADYDAALTVGAARPVAASRVLRPRNGRAVALGAGEHVVMGGRVDATLDPITLLVEPGFLADLVVVAVQVRHIGRDLHALGVEPRPVADAVLGVHPARALRREIGAPRLAARAGGLGEALAIAVGTCQPAEVAALAEPDAGDGEAHGPLLRLRGRARAESQERHGRNHR